MKYVWKPAYNISFCNACFLEQCYVSISTEKIFFENNQTSFANLLFESSILFLV